MIDVKGILYEICEDESVYEDNTDLFETGIFDSFVFIELFNRLEDEGLELQPTRIDRSMLRTPAEIQRLVARYSVPERVR